MGDKVLFVDDEPAVLDGYRRVLQRDFAIETAVGGETGLAAAREHGPFSVIISDMRMPGMSGSQFLGHVRQEFPDTVRMLLTGHADMDAAIEAVNEGQIFRFLTKPCDKDTLSKAITSGLVQFRLITAEKELLENTLLGCIRVLTDVLSAVNPEAFGKSLRISRCVMHVVKKLGLSAGWRYEAAAMLSQLGCVTLDAELMQSAYMGKQLSPGEQARFDAHPGFASDLLVNIPRLEPIAWMISQQNVKDISGKSPTVPALPKEAIVLGAKILRLALAFDHLKTQGLSDQEAVGRMKYRCQEFGTELVEALSDMKTEGNKQPRKILITQLSVGMILQEEIRNKTGVVLVAKGQEITYALLARLQNVIQSRSVNKEIAVLAPA
jgi:response regulator RpfG family c-di-GMP phosphodiesterase